MKVEEALARARMLLPPPTRKEEETMGGSYILVAQAQVKGIALTYPFPHLGEFYELSCRPKGGKGARSVRRE